MTVYNTKTAGDVTPGTYINDGEKWVRVAGALDVAPVITTQPAKFSFKRLRDTDGDPHGPAASAAAITLTVVASNATKYQWYKKAVNTNAPDMLINGATSASYTYSPADVNVANWGLYQFYCVVSNASDSVKSNMAEIALGCGAKTVTGGWLKFMCYNLGAEDTNADPFSYKSGETKILGKFYQWGRKDAADRANTATNWTNAPYYPYDWKIPNGYTSALSDSYHQNDYLWRHHRVSTDACPSGWHVPSLSAFAAIFKGTSDGDKPVNATVNTWTPTGSFSEGTGNGGFAIQPYGETTTLFFPAQGFRDKSDGSVSGVGQFGTYWTGDAAESGALVFWFQATFIAPGSVGERGRGLSVRCLAE
jgi:uncharacterized protein (TIGR02145 family)